jgi:hypothetical protein
MWCFTIAARCVACLPACLPSFFPACLSACLPYSYLLACLPTDWSSACYRTFRRQQQSAGQRNRSGNSITERALAAAEGQC